MDYTPQPKNFVAALLLAAVALCVLGGPVATAAPAFPDKPVRIIVPFPPGAAADAATRVVAQKLTEYWGVTVLVENRSGAPGMQAAALSAADGYTLLLSAGSLMVTTPLLTTKLVYDPVRDFVAIGRVVTIAPVLTTTPSLGVKTVKELIALLKTKPGKLNFSSSGNGAPNQLAMELFMQMTGTDMLHVPYKGGAQPVLELVSGRIQVGINAVPSVLGQIKSGGLTPLAVASKTRARQLPDVPTISEAGVPGFEYDIWYGLFAPAKTPPDIVAKVSADLQRALRDENVVKKLQDQGSDAAPTTAQTLTQYISEDSAKWKKIVKERNLTLD
jgi:tripartite-type tricarboxylate transporter receptor subunit TctC